MSRKPTSERMAEWGGEPASFAVEVERLEARLAAIEAYVSVYATKLYLQDINPEEFEGGIHERIHGDLSLLEVSP